MRIVIVVAAAAALHAQSFQSMTTTDDGSVLYFSSAVRQTGTDQSFHSKIFRWDQANGLRVIAEQRERGASDGCNYANFFDLAVPSVTADGATLAYTATRPVGGGRMCLPVEGARGVIVQGGRESVIEGITAISRNGRYAVSAPRLAVESQYHFVTDLTTRTTSVVAGAFNGAWSVVTDEGAVLNTERMALVLYDRNGGTRLLRTEYPVDEAIVDRSGRTAVYVTRLGPSTPGRIAKVDVASGAETEVYRGFAPGNVSISGDGSTILFVEWSQVYVAGPAVRQVTNEADKIMAAVLSGNGRVAYALTGSSRLVRIDVASGAVTELASPAPVATTMYRLYQPARGRIAVGSVVDLFGSGISDLTSVKLCGRDLPATRGSQAQLVFQAPWDLPEGSCRLIVRSTAFEHGIEVEVRQYDPIFGPVLSHDGFSGNITPASPASAGEVMVAYMGGLGPVDDSGRLRRPGFGCQFDGIETQVEYAGLTANYPGVYQVNVRVPDISNLSASLTCGWDIEARASIGVPVTRLQSRARQQAVGR